MTDQLQELQDFILKFTKFEFKEKDNWLVVWAFFQYEGINVTIEGYSIDRNDELGTSINRVILMMIGDSTNKAFKIYQRDQKIENILKIKK
jgi:hypothetical protein